MRRIALTALLFAAVCLAQTSKEKYMTPGTGGSPPKLAEVKFGQKDVWIVYHAPSVNGRKVFGSEDALERPGTIWRLGADQATFLHTDAELDFAGLKVPKGEYTLYMDLDQGQWKLVVSKQTGQWGIGRGGTSLKESEAVGRVAMTMSKPAPPVEQMEIQLESAGAGKGKLTVAWENVSAAATFTAN